MHVLIQRLLYSIFIVSISFAVVSCAGQKDNLAALPEQKLYEASQRALKRSDYLGAIEALQKLESDFPFGKYAQSSQLSLVFAYFKTDDNALADSSAKRFIRLHPNHTDVDYAYYMLGLNSYPKPGSLFQTFIGADLSKKDTKSAQIAFANFSQLVTRFPESQYTADSIKRLEFLRNLLARSEIHIANYYLGRQAFLSAANRGRFVVENYQETPSMPDALAIMVQSYHALGMQDLGQNSLEVLRLNYPDYPALNIDGEFNYQYYVKDVTSVIGLATFGLIDYSKPPGFDTRNLYGRF
jgi:outer membrane protein assembly factor BamD